MNLKCFWYKTFSGSTVSSKLSLEIEIVMQLFYFVFILYLMLGILLW